MPDSLAPRALTRVDKSRRSRWNGYEQPSLFEGRPDARDHAGLSLPCDLCGDRCTIDDAAEPAA